MCTSAFTLSVLDLDNEDFAKLQAGFGLSLQLHGPTIGFCIFLTVIRKLCADLNSLSSDYASKDDEFPLQKLLCVIPWTITASHVQGCF